MSGKETLIAILHGGPHGAPAPAGMRLLRAGDFTAVLAEEQPRGFALLPNRRQALERAAHRQAQWEDCMPLGTVLPVRPDQYLADPAVAAFLRANGQALGAVAERVARAQQYQVTVQWQAAAVLGHFRDAPEIAPLFAAERTTAQALQAAVQRLAARLHRVMQEKLSVAARELILLPQTEDVIFNAVVLVEQSDTHRLDGAVERIDGIWPDGFVVRQIGPAPASSFALIDPVWVSAAQVADAHVTLGIAPGADDTAIAAARRAALMQPGAEAEHLRLAAETVQAASRLGAAQDGLHLLRTLSDGPSTVTEPRQEVA